MSVLTQHRGACLGSLPPKPIADLTLVNMGSGLSGTATLSAPAGRVAGSMMFALVNQNQSTSYDPTKANANWTDVTNWDITPGGGGGSRNRGRIFKRIADGTSADDLIVNVVSSAGYLFGYMVASRGYTQLLSATPSLGHCISLGTNDIAIPTGITAPSAGVQVGVGMQLGNSTGLTDTITLPGGLTLFDDRFAGSGGQQKAQASIGTAAIASSGAVGSPGNIHFASISAGNFDDLAVQYGLFP